jgi:Flp pilus assembly protein TadG
MADRAPDHTSGRQPARSGSSDGVRISLATSDERGAAVMELVLVVPILVLLLLEAFDWAAWT